MIIPRVGDIWEFKLPGRLKRVKEIGSIYLRWYEGKWDGHQFTRDIRRPAIEWYRLPKGRYTGIRPKTLLKYGRRISTKAERDARLKAMVAARRAQIEQEVPNVT